jgi:hypothetical protein
MKAKVIDLLEDVCNCAPCDTSVYDNYSGRGAFGRKCLGISCDRFIPIIELAAQRGIKGAQYDQLGHGYIVYWPKYNEESEIDLVELREVEDEE